MQTILNHEKYMRRCIELARKATGKTYPNPLVGSVIVHNNKIIGEGYHQKAGEPHAEINAINSVKNRELLQESTMYVSLEPCSHYGKTPPCALKLKEIGFKTVVIGTLDSHEKVNGKGKEILEQAGIDVISGILEQECKALNKRFFTFHEKKRPYLILKWAESGDGFLDKDFSSAAISNPLVNQMVHQMRADEHAILVGTQTALNDNPSLTVRHVSGQNPVRILIDFDLKVPVESHIFNSEARTVVFNTIKNEKKDHIEFIKTERNNVLQILMKRLYEAQIQSVIIEGGRFTLQQFIDAGLWDEAVVIKNEKLLFRNGTAAPIMNGDAFCTKEIKDNIIHFYRNYR